MCCVVGKNKKIQRLIILSICMGIHLCVTAINVSDNFHYKI